MSLPETRDQVVANIIAFDNALRNPNVFSDPVRNSLFSTLSYAKGWVGIKHSGDYRFGPLMWCGGGQNMTADRYHRLRQNPNGTSASNIIGELFYQEEGWDDYTLENTHRGVRALRDLARQVAGRELFANTRFYMLPGEAISDDHRATVQAILQDIAQADLSATARLNLRARVPA